MKKRTRKKGHYFLEQRGLKHVGHDQLFDRDGREPQWRKERFKYGYDERFTWSLDQSIYLTMYETLCYYKYNADKYIDLTYHDVELSKGKMTQIEAMDYVIEELYWLCSTDIAWSDNAEEKEERRIKALADYAKLLPYLWW